MYTRFDRDWTRHHGGRFSDHKSYLRGNSWFRVPPMSARESEYRVQWRRAYTPKSPGEYQLRLFADGTSGDWDLFCGGVESSPVSCEA